MKRNMTWGLFCCVTALLFCAAAARADYAAGEAAWDDGRHVEAVAEWRAAAEEDDARAMRALGRAFVKGLGVLQDYVEAHKWLNLAAGRGVTDAAAERDALAAEMSAEERAEAKKLAREWRSGTRWPAGKEFRDCAGCPLMVVVPAGSFMMGSPAGEEHRNGNEDPVHRVEIAKPFAVGKYEVTRAEFARFVEETGHSTGNFCRTLENGDWKDRRGRGWKRPGFSQSDSHPVVCVNWDDARSYAEWLSGETGAGYRLLSEAEWEYTARAGTTGPFHFGSTISTDQANYHGDYTYGSGRKGVYREETVPVGSFPSNGFGLHDMHGNVWEWVEDCWDASYSGAPTDGSVWRTGRDCFWRVRALRGGSWSDFPRELRSANRGSDTPGLRYNDDGFRVARTLIP